MKDKEIQGMQIRICNACKQHKKCDKELCTMSELVAKELSRFYQPKLPKDSVVLSMECVSDKWIDLLTEFDEMGFEPTTLPPNDMSVEEYTAFYKNKLLMCLAKASKETAKDILDEVSKHFGGKWLVELYKKYGLDWNMEIE